ncbi:hypothetical protein ACFX2J_000993 [Malus domestica]
MGPTAKLLAFWLKLVRTDTGPARKLAQGRADGHGPSTEAGPGTCVRSPSKLALVFGLQGQAQPSRLAYGSHGQGLRKRQASTKACWQIGPRQGTSPVGFRHPRV